MARRRSRQYVVPEAQQGMKLLKMEVMRREGYVVDPNSPDNVKFEVARRVGVPLEQGYNGELPAKQAGKIGGQIGGVMVREMVRMAQESLAKSPR